MLHFVLLAVSMELSPCLVSVPFKSYQLLDYNRGGEGRKNEKLEGTHVSFQKQFEMPTHERTLVLCLDEDYTTLVENPEDDGLLENEVKLYTGGLCEDIHSRVFGSIVDGAFHGTIVQSDGWVHRVEDIFHYPTLRAECPKCHSVLYSEMGASSQTNNLLPPPPPPPPPLPLSTLNCTHGETLKNRTSPGSTSKRQKPPTNDGGIYCDMTILIHHSYLELCGSLSTCLSVISRHISVLNKVLQFQWNNHDQPVLQYQIRRVQVVGVEHPLNAEVAEPSSLLFSLGELALELDTCITGIYLAKEWEGNRLGLSVVPDDPSEGICSQSGVYAITIRSSDGIQAPMPHLITTLHEMGHTLGSLHDPYIGCQEPECYSSPASVECSPGWGRNYIMHYVVKFSNHRNNLLFSPCSFHSISNFLALPDRTCLRAARNAVCGNGIIEEDEECDTGEKSSGDKCCGSPTSNRPCQLVRGVCSPSQGECCTRECVWEEPGRTCGAGNECRQPQMCRGDSAVCHLGDAIPDSQPCHNYSATCRDGECAGHLCDVLHGWACVCNATNECTICCRASGQHLCLPLEHSLLPNVSALPRGVPCNHGLGRCDGRNHCEPINPLFEAFSRIRNVATDLMRFLRLLLMNHGFGLAVLSVALLLAGLIALIYHSTVTAVDCNRRRPFLV